MTNKVVIFFLIPTQKKYITHKFLWKKLRKFCWFFSLNCVSGLKGDGIIRGRRLIRGRVDGFGNVDHIVTVNHDDNAGGRRRGAAGGSFLKILGLK